ncbi:MAG: type IV toxin-antitoxin system AbiEi family antitoxin domain-containing protein [Turicibacter sp.]|nr:type IV toxin-antitoxin system AbiEi family antitoxin domain-containing protein [Turicibacter sp.]
MNPDIENLLEQNNGYLTATVAKEHGISSKMLAHFVNNGSIERVAHGLYMSSDLFADPFFIFQYRCPKAVFSHETALYLHDLSDRDPLILMATLPTGSSSRLQHEKAHQFFYNHPDKIKLGVCEVETENGLLVKAFDKERTLCDCIKYLNQLDRDLVLTALKRYLKSPERDNVKLLDYATLLNVRQQVYSYLEVM